MHTMKVLHHKDKTLRVDQPNESSRGSCPCAESFGWPTLEGFVLAEQNFHWLPGGHTMKVLHHNSKTLRFDKPKDSAQIQGVPPPSLC